jgi:hypothetical protein
MSRGVVLQRTIVDQTFLQDQGANKTPVKLSGGRERPLTLGDIMVYALCASGTGMQVQTGRKRLRQIHRTGAVLVRTLVAKAASV